MTDGDDRARLNTHVRQAQSRAADIRLQTLSIVQASRRCFESSELLLAVEQRRALPP